MKNLILITIILALSFVIYTFLSHKREQLALIKKMNSLHKEGLQPKKDVSNPFYPEGEVFLCDSILSSDNVVKLFLTATLEQVKSSMGIVQLLS